MKGQYSLREKTSASSKHQTINHKSKKDNGKDINKE